MAKKSGSKSSRSERRAGRKRAERAVQHGLPTRQRPPLRARAATPEPGRNDGIDRSSDAPRAPVAKPGGIPMLVKVLGAAFAILVGAYLLSRQRDEALTESQPAPEPPVVAASAAPAVGAPGEASPPPPEVTAAPTSEPPAAIVSVTPPTKPVVGAPGVAAPFVSVPSKPKIQNASVAPARPPGAATAPVAVPVPSPPAPAAAPVAPTPPKPAAPKPPSVDNPY